MPDLRKDPVVGRWVIIAPDRAKRPLESAAVVAALPEMEDAFDPFLEGNEQETPPEILAFREPDSVPDEPGWRVRVIPNKFPALQANARPTSRSDGFYCLMPGVGVHEVIIECPQFEESLACLPVEQFRELLLAYLERLRSLAMDERLAHGLIFKNKGAAAGASLPHSHSQLIATPIVPIAIWEELQGAEEYFLARGECVFCAMLRKEIESRGRVVIETSRFLAFCPFASRFPFETWIVPKHHASQFEHLSDEDVTEMGLVLKTILGKLRIALDDPPYNYFIHSAPFRSGELPHFHWHLELTPQLTRFAGFEWGSGFFINPVLPEQAAALLCEVEV